MMPIGKRKHKSTRIKNEIPQLCGNTVGHGSVYPDAYDLFKDFKYNPIEDARFAVFSETSDALTDHEKKVDELVVNTFGMYSGKALVRNINDMLA